jgi:hypothetical protein
VRDFVREEICEERSQIVCVSIIAVKSGVKNGNSGKLKTEEGGLKKQVKISVNFARRNGSLKSQGCTEKAN